jgi:hypothetical protein
MRITKDQEDLTTKAKKAQKEKMKNLIRKRVHAQEPAFRRGESLYIHGARGKDKAVFPCSTSRLLHRMKFPGFLVTALFLSVSAFSQDWYLSNPSGLALERSPSKITALHADWSVSVEQAEESVVPDILRPYYETGFSIELRVLYNQGKPVRRQWIFRSGSVTRLNASMPVEERQETDGKTSEAEQSAGDRPEDETGRAEAEVNQPEDETGRVEDEVNQPEDGTDSAEAEVNRPEDGTGRAEAEVNQLEDGTEQPEAEADRPKADRGEGRLPFIEIYSPEYLLTELFQIRASGERYSTRYRYSGGVLVGSETRLDGELLWSDEYRYTRNYKLRGVERRYAEKEVAEESAGLVQLRFPPRGLSFISPDSPYDYRLRTGALRDVFMTEAATVRYSTDGQGRVTYEEHFDKDGKQLASLTNEWSEERLLSVTWSSGGVSGKVEFDYTPDGENAAERNYRNGVLERKVTRDGNREIEELYRNGEPVLRAVWEDGRKITEERL